MILELINMHPTAFSSLYNIVEARMTRNFCGLEGGTTDGNFTQDMLQKVALAWRRNSGFNHTACSPNFREDPAIHDDTSTGLTSKPSAHVGSSFFIANAGIVQLTPTRTYASKNVDLPKDTMTPRDLIRQRRRKYQRKYRKQQRDYTENLDYGVRRIQEEIASLEQQVQFASMGISRSQSVWSAAVDYFRLFRQGLLSPTYTVYSCVLNVLESFVAPDVSDDLLCGSKAVLTKWMLFSLCFEDIYVELQRLEKGPLANSVVATVITNITISVGSLHLLFPHLVEVEENIDKRMSLAEKLLGSRLTVRGSVVFEWDDTIDRVIKMQSRSDMITPMLQVLGNLEDVSHAFGGSFVTPESCWPQFVV